MGFEACRRAVLLTALVATAGLAGCKGTSPGDQVGTKGDPYRQCPESAVRTSEAAQALLQAGKAAEALPLLRQVALDHPNFVPGMINYQDTAMQLGGDAQQAMAAHYKAWAEAEPQNPVARHGLIRIAPDLASRVRGLNTLAEEVPGYYCVQLDLARQYRSVDRYSDAVRYYRAALELEDRWYMAHRELAELLVTTGRAREAVRHLEVVLDARPRDDGIREQLARLLIYELDRPDDAVVHIENLKTRRPDDPAVRMHEAAILWRQGDYLSARKVYLEVLEAEPHLAEAALNLGNLCFEPLPAATPGGRGEWWPKARLAYLYFQQEAGDQGGYEVFDQLLATPYRLKLIETELGPRTGGDGPVRVADLR